MKVEARSPKEYISKIPEDRQPVMTKLREVINANLPEGFKEVISYNMIGWVVPHDKYPDGYHCDPKRPLPFMNLASQKNFIAFYHMGIYATPELLVWLVNEYPKYVSTKLDMGKSCIRLKKMGQIPIKLIGELVAKMTVQDWIDKYESEIKR